MSSLGHKVLFFEANKSTTNAIKPKHIKRFKPDVLWFLNPFYIKKNKEAVQYAKDKGIPIIVYGTLNPQTPFMDWLEHWKKIDFLFVHNLELSEYLKSQGLRSYFLPLGFYKDMYFKDVSVKKNIDVSFCGNVAEEVSPNKDKRCIFLQSLYDFKTKVYGASFYNKLSGIQVSPYSTHKKQRRVYSKTKVNLDLPFYSRVHPFYENRYHLKNRFFEIPATGNFMLTLRYPETELIYDESHVGFYDPNVDSLREEVGRYLKDKDLREKKAFNAYKYVWDKHTFKQRFKDMFNILASFDIK
jgi:spore maturation protein CgeB